MIKPEESSRPKTGKQLMQDLLPDLTQLRDFARHLFSERNQGPLHHLGLEVADITNIEKLPSIRRARDFHLYSFTGKRYLDLYRGEGFNLLGYSIPGFHLGIKNRIAQALWQGMPHPLHKQLSKVLEQVFPQHHAVICPDRYRVSSVLELLNMQLDRPLMPTRDDLTGENTDRALSYWFPFTGSPSPVTLALLPSLGVQGPYVLLVSNDIFAHHLSSFGNHEHEVFSVLRFISNQVPVYALTALMTALSTLEGLGAFAGLTITAVGPDKINLGALNHPRTKGLNQQLGIWRESSWQKIAISPWKRSGPYIYHSFSATDYCQVFSFALSLGIVLNPRSDGVNCLPGVMSDGEKKQLEAVLAYQPKGEV